MKNKLYHFIFFYVKKKKSIMFNITSMFKFIESYQIEKATNNKNKREKKLIRFFSRKLIFFHKK